MFAGAVQSAPAFLKEAQMSKGRKIAIALVLVALVAVAAVVLLKTNEYSAGVDYYSGLR